MIKSRTLVNKIKILETLNNYTELFFHYNSYLNTNYDNLYNFYYNSNNFFANRCNTYLFIGTKNKEAYFLHFLNYRTDPLQSNYVFMFKGVIILQNYKFSENNFYSDNYLYIQQFHSKQEKYIKINLTLKKENDLLRKEMFKGIN